MALDQRSFLLMHLACYLIVQISQSRKLNERTNNTHERTLRTVKFSITPFYNEVLKKIFRNLQENPLFWLFVVN